MAVFRNDSAPVILSHGAILIGRRDGVKSVIADAGRLFTTVLSPPRQMTSPHVPAGNLENIRNFPPWSDEPFFFCFYFSEAWIPSGPSVCDCSVWRTVVCLVRPHVSPASLPSAQKAGPILTTSPPQHTHTHTQLPRKPTQDPPAVARRACKLQERTHTRYQR